MTTAIVGRSGVFTVAEEELSEDYIKQQFGSLIKGAVSTFARDPSYFVEMVESANTISYRRAVWDVRKEVAAAEKTARVQCELDNRECPFACANAGACGYGECRYATDGNARILTGLSDPDASGLSERPVGQEARHPLYRLQDTIDAVLADRAIVSPAKTAKRCR